MAFTLDELRQRPNALARFYTRFRVAERLLLTAHSHQAWPDRAEAGQMRAFEDAAALVDEKWGRAFHQANRVRQAYGNLLNDDAGSVALAASTHDLLVKLLSALPLQKRPRLLTSDGEYHTLRRQLARLEEEGIEVVREPADDPSTLAARLAAKVDDKTAAVLVSSVLFRSGRIVPGLGQLAKAAEKAGAELVVDVFHQLNVIPCNLEAEGLGGAFVVGGGYKYCQLGEGNCFLRVPPGRDLRPVITGWFAEFGEIAAPTPEMVAYGRGAEAFAGATYDPTSHYRANEVFDFFRAKDLDPPFLRQVSQHQVGLLAKKFDQLDLDPKKIRRPKAKLEELGGFLALESEQAGKIFEKLKERHVLTDYRDTWLRFGPAPYHDDSQLEEAIGHLGEVVAEL
jgi:kynureninase